MAQPSINHGNLGRLILAARAIVNLTRVELAKKASLAHATLKQAEEGEDTVPDEALTRICRAVEALGFEFLDGTNSVSIAYHEPEEVPFAAMTADPSMPGWVRRIYPRELDARSLVRDLKACGVMINMEDRLLDLCATRSEPWLETFAEMALTGRKFGIEFFWRNDEENLAGVRHILKIYELDARIESALLQNILKGNMPAAKGA